MSPILNQDICKHPGCGVLKRESNRWWALHVEDNGYTVTSWESAVLSGQPDGYWEFYCGQGHLMVRETALMTGPQPNPQRERTLELKKP
jgi:hypothetical protein